MPVAIDWPPPRTTTADLKTADRLLVDGDCPQANAPDPDATTSFPFRERSMRPTGMCPSVFTANI
jgi:hypothetical protein